MLDIDAIMHNLIVAKLGKGIADDNPYHWILINDQIFPIKYFCLFCGGELEDLGSCTDQHALKHIKDLKLTAFL